MEVSFSDGKKGYILRVGRVGKSLEDSIENMYYVSGLKYSFLGVSHICDKGMKSSFCQTNALSPVCLQKKVIPMARRRKKLYVGEL